MYNPQELRLYTFTNFYMSPIQHGIQSAHVVHELFLKYTGETHRRDTLLDWAKNHKTMIVLSAGNLAGLEDMLDVIEPIGALFPWSEFNEDQASLGGILTCVGIVLPSSVFDVKLYESPALTNRWYWMGADGKIIEHDVDSDLGKFITALKGCRLA